MQSEALFLVKYGDANEAFEQRPYEIPSPGAGQVMVEVEAFGLNFADVMARKGLYKAAPPAPSVLGYEVVGRIRETGPGVNDLETGTRVLAITRFGAYARHAIADRRGVIPVPENMGNGTAAALGTQYITAMHAAYDMANVQEGEHVLIHAAAGGVGTALVQLAKHRGCTVYGTSSSEEKISFMKQNGADFGIDYTKTDFTAEIRRIRNGKGVDVAIDPVGGRNFRNSLRLLEYGGRIVGYGASDQLNTSMHGFLGKVRLMLGFGFMHPVPLLLASRGVLGVNLLVLADNKPDVVQRCLTGLMDLWAKGIARPHIGAEFRAQEIAKAHAFIESRKSMGKIVLNW